mmetsp:Transcript_29568/g.70242  ORF Transcript_29568/g.70242 Transcript_29568/m.70242 type:complete len:263 (+) Transcript_29568:50-838(+)
MLWCYDAMMMKHAIVGFLLLSLGFDLKVSAQSSPSSRLRRTKFYWRADLASPPAACVASSIEVSKFQSAGVVDLPPKRKTVVSIFSEYPLFLQRPSLTFGLCRVKPSTDGSYELRTFLLAPLLVFGKPRAINRKGRPDWLNGVSEGCAAWDALCCIELPIEGGLLANTRIETVKSSKKSDYGCLRFSFYQTICTDKGADRPCSCVIVVTEIAGGYSPALAGFLSKYLPFRFRKFVYSNSQRLLHEYVMWKYHAHVMNELELA